MPRKPKITNLEEEIIQEAEIVTRWSLARIIIAVFLLIIIIGGGILSVRYLMNNSKKVLGTQADYKPHINLPNEERVQDVIEKAKRDLSDINPKNIIESQPQIQKIINDLQNISSSSNSARTLICDSLCK